MFAFAPADRSIPAPEPTLSGEAGKDGPPGGGGGGGLEGGEGGGLLGLCGRWMIGAAVEVFEEAGDEAVGAGGVGGEEFGAGGDGAEVRVGDDVFDHGLLGGLGEGGAGVGEVERGDLEAVKEKAGAAGVELVVGEPVEDLSDGELDGAAVLWNGEGEGGGALLALGHVRHLNHGGGDGSAGVGGVVVEAEVLGAEAGAAAAVAVGEDVTALEAAGLGGGLGCGDGLGHGGYPSPWVLLR